MLRLVQTARSRVAFPSAHSLAAFSTSAVSEDATSAIASPSVPRVPALSERYVDGRSPTQLILEVLKTGPKTRKQIYYALNRGAPTPEAVEAAAAAAAAAAAPLGANAAAKQKARQDLSEQPHVYPTGVLRNPTHLRRLLKGLLDGSRLWARPLASLEARMGEKERESVAAITRDHPHSAVLAAATVTKGARTTSSLAKVGAGWVYVLRDWADAGFAAKGPAKQAQYAAKMERRRAKKQEALEAAIAGGSVMAAKLGKVMAVSRNVRRKAEKAAKLEAFNLKVNEETVKYRDAVLHPQAPSEAKLEYAEAYCNLVRALKPHIKESHLADVLETSQLSDAELSMKLRRENPKLREDALKASLAARAKWNQWVEKRSVMSAEHFGNHLRNANKTLHTGTDLTQEEIDQALLQRDQALSKLAQLKAQ